MTKCFDCGKEYESRPGGDIMIAWCYECRAKPRPPDRYIRKNGLFITNPEWERYEKAHQARQETVTPPTTQKPQAGDTLAREAKEVQEL